MTEIEKKCKVCNTINSYTTDDIFVKKINLNCIQEDSIYDSYECYIVCSSCNSNIRVLKNIQKIDDFIKSNQKSNQETINLT